MRRKNTDHELRSLGHDSPMDERREFSIEDERKLTFPRTLRVIDDAVIAPVGTASE